MSTEDETTSQIEHRSSLKQHARLRNSAAGSKPILDVYDQKDWELMHRPEIRSQLVCWEPSCQRSLHPRTSGRKDGPGIRFLAYNGGQQPCGHVRANTRVVTNTPRGGGEMTPEHAWTERRVFRVVKDMMKLNAVFEERPTYADVLIKTPAHQRDLALEVQLRTDDFARREHQRRQANADTIWLFPPSADDSGVRRALQENPSVRLYLSPMQNPYDSFPVMPWDDDPDKTAECRKANRQGRLFVGETLATVVPAASPQGARPTVSFRSTVNGGTQPTRMDLCDFIRHILAGRWHWYRAGALPGLTRGAWLSTADATILREYQQPDERPACAPTAPAAPTAEPIQQTQSTPGTRPTPLPASPPRVDPSGSPQPAPEPGLGWGPVPLGTGSDWGSDSDSMPNPWPLDGPENELDPAETERAGDATPARLPLAEDLGPHGTAHLTPRPSARFRQEVAPDAAGSNCPIGNPHVGHGLGGFSRWWVPTRRWLRRLLRR